MSNAQSLNALFAAAASAKTKLVIRIGHPSYQGANRLFYAFSKKQAVEELRDRGFTRNRARELVKQVCETYHGYTTASVSSVSDIVEIANYTNDNTGYGLHGEQQCSE